MTHITHMLAFGAPATHNAVLEAVELAGPFLPYGQHVVVNHAGSFEDFNVNLLAYEACPEARPVAIVIDPASLISKNRMASRIMTQIFHDVMDRLGQREYQTDIVHIGNDRYMQQFWKNGFESDEARHAYYLSLYDTHAPTPQKLEKALERILEAQ